MSKISISRALPIFAISAFLFASFPTLSWASENGGTNVPPAGVIATTIAMGESSAATKPAPTGPTVTPKPVVTSKATANPKPTSSPSPAPSFVRTTPSSSPCALEIFTNGVGNKFIAALTNLFLFSVTCTPVPDIVTNTTDTLPPISGTSYFAGSGSKLVYSNAPSSAYTAPFNTAGYPTTIQSAAAQCANAPVISDYNGLVQLHAYKIPYTDFIKNNIKTTSPGVGAAGPVQTIVTTLDRNTVWGDCEYPSVHWEQCQINLTSVDYSGVTGKNTDPQVVIPTGSAPAVSAVGSSTTTAGNWSNVNVSSPTTDPSVPNQEIAASGSVWNYAPVKPIETKIGTLLRTKPSDDAIASHFISSTGKTLPPTKECGGDPFLSITVPLPFVTDGEYELKAHGNSVYCYIIERESGGNSFSGCSKSLIPQTVNRIFSKKCDNIVLGSLGADYSSLACGKITTNATNTPPGPGGSSSSSNPLPAGSTFNSTPTYSCSIKGSPKVTNPLGGTISSSTTIQALSQAIATGNASSNSTPTPWRMTWDAPTFSSYGNMNKASITNQSTALLLAPGSAPYNYGSASTADNQPVTATPSLSLATDANPYTLPGWNVPSTITFYKKGDAGSKITVAQEAIFSALFPFPKVTTNSATGATTVTQGWVMRTGQCSADKSVSFQVVGVSTLP